MVVHVGRGPTVLHRYAVDAMPEVAHVKVGRIAFSGLAPLCNGCGYVPLIFIYWLTDLTSKRLPGNIQSRFMVA